MKFSHAPAAWLAALSVVVLLPISQLTHAKNLRWSSQGDILTLDPHATNESFNNNMNNQVYEYLTQRDKQYKVVPWLATSWENVDPHKWIVRLRKGVRFHDGTPFTADDVVFSFDRARAANSTFKLYATQAGIARRIDDYTVEFTTSVPNPLFHESIGTIFIMSRRWAEKNHVAKAQDFRGKEDSFAARNAMGTGPFKLVSYEAGVKTLHKKNADWWGIKEGWYDGNVDSTEYRPITNSSTRMAALRSGEVDFVLDPPVQEILKLREEKALKVWEGNEIRVIFVSLQQGRDKLLGGEDARNPFKDRRVRQALYQAIDIDTLRKQIMRGLSTPTAIMLPDPQGAGVSLILEKRVPFDPPNAKKLLKEAGYPDGFAFTLTCPNDRYVNDEKICVALAIMWAKIGVRAHVEAIPKAQFFQKIANFDTSAYLYGWGGGSPEAVWLLKPIMYSRGSSRGGGDNNYSDVREPRLDTLIDAIETEMDTAARHRLVASAVQFVQDEFLALPLHRQVIPWVSRADMSVVHRPNNWLVPIWVNMK